MKRWLLALLLSAAVVAGEAQVLRLATVAMDGNRLLDAVPAGWRGVGTRSISLGGWCGLVDENGRVVTWREGAGFDMIARPASLGEAVQIACATTHLIVRMADGTVVGWGSNTNGAAAPPGGLTGVIKVAAGYSFSLALKSDGTVVTWGTGIGAIPAPNSGIIDIAAGTSHALAVRSDGSVVAWGDTSYGQLTVPGAAVGVVKVGAGVNVSGALRSDGQLVLWGKAGAGPPVGTYSTFAFSEYAGAAIATDGTCHVWNQASRTTWAGGASATALQMIGYGYSGSTYPALIAITSAGLASRIDDTYSADYQAPQGPIDVARLPVGHIIFSNGQAQLDAGPAISILPAGTYSDIAYDGFYYGLRTNGTIGAPGGDANITSLSQVTSIAGATTTFVYTKADGWGHFLAGSTDITVPLANGSTKGVCGSNGNWAVYLQSNGTVVGHGNNAWGQLDVPADLPPVRDLACGNGHVVALLRDGTVRCWGDASVGQATPPAGMGPVVAVAAGGYRSLAVGLDGRVHVWGRNATMPAGITRVRRAHLTHAAMRLSRNLEPIFIGLPATSAAGLVQAQIDLNWPVADLTMSDLVASNASVEALSGSGGTYTVTLKPSAPGAVGVSLAAGACTSADGWASLPAGASYQALALTADAAVAQTAEDTDCVISLPNPNPVAVTYQVVAGPGHGSLSAFSGNQATYSPAAGWSGSDSFTYRVSNGAYWSAAATVSITVRMVNRAPTLAAVGGLAVLEDAAQQAVALSGIGPGRASESGQVLSVTATSSNAAVVPDPTVSYVSGQTTGSLAVAPVANATGSAVITVRVQDDGGTSDGGVNAVTRTFTVTVGAVNDPPTLAFIAGRSIAEDAPQQSVTLSGISIGPANEAGQVLAPVAFSTAPAVVGHPTIDYTAGSTTATLRWQPVADANGQARIFVTFSDDGGIADGGADSVSQSFLVDVTPVNDAPVLVRHDAVSLVVSTTRAIGSDVLQTTDVDAPPAASLVYTLTVAPTLGQLLRSGVAVAAGGTFTQADIDANLLTYQAGAAVGADSCSFTVSDGIAAALPAAAVAITIQPSGGGGATPPLVTLDTGVSTYVEGGAVLPISPSATVHDGDSADFSGGSLRVELTQNGTAADRLAIQAGGRVSLSGATVLVDGANVGTWSGGIGLAALQIACTASATPDRIQALLCAIVFSNVSNAPSALERRVQVVVSDGDGGSSVPASRQIAVVPVNSPPDIALPTAAVAFTEGGGAIAINPAALASDDDSAGIDGGSLQVAITAGGDSADRLQLADSGPVTVSGGTVSHGGTVVGSWTTGDSATPLRVDFAGVAATPAVAEDVLRAVRFANASTAPSAAPRTLRATLSDGLDTSAPATVVVAVATVNDPPVVAVPDAPNFTEAGGAVRLSPNATVGDPDSADFNGGSLTVRLAGGATADDALLVLHEGDGANQVGVTGAELRYGGMVIGTAVGGSGFAPVVVSFASATVTPAVARAVLRRIAFDNASSNPLAGARTVAVRAADGDGGQSDEVSLTLQVTDINAAPTLSAAGTVSWTEDAAGVAVAPGALIGDGDSADFAGGSLSAVITVNVAAGDRLRIRHVGSAAGQVGVDAGRILVGGVEVGSWSGGDGGAALVVAFAGAAATPAAAQAVAQQIVFDSTSQAPSAARRAIDLVVNDGDGDASPAATVSVDVVPQNDPPQLAAQTLAVAAGAAATAGLAGGDPEGDACVLELVAAPDAASGTLTILDAAAWRVRFVPAAGFAGTAAFTVRLRETVSGLLSADRTIAVRVTGSGEPRPQAASEPPREAFRSREWRWRVRVDTTGLADALPVGLALEGAPAGMQLIGDEAVWQVPADQALGVVRFGVRFATPSAVAGWQDVLLVVRPAPGGGG